MSHTHAEKDRLKARLRRIVGQVAGVERALDAEAPCGEVLRQLAAVRGAIASLTREVLEEHLRHHVLDPESDGERRQGGEELMEVLRTYFR